MVLENISSLPKQTVIGYIESKQYELLMQKTEEF